MSRSSDILAKANSIAEDALLKATAEEDAGPPREANIADRIRSIAGKLMKHDDPEVRSMAAEILEHVKVLKGER